MSTEELPYVDIPLEAIETVCTVIHRAKVNSHIDAHYTAYQAIRALEDAGYHLTSTPNQKRNWNSVRPSSALDKDH